MRNLESPIPGYDRTILTWSWCKICKQVSRFSSLYPFQPSVAFHIETSYLLCNAWLTRQFKFNSTSALLSPGWPIEFRILQELGPDIFYEIL